VLLGTFYSKKGAYSLEDDSYIHLEREAAKRRHPAYQSKHKSLGKIFIKSLANTLDQQKEQK